MINTNNVKHYINRQGQKLGKSFQKEIINRTRQLSVKMQKDLTNSVDKGSVPFTTRSILFTYKKSTTGVVASILVKNVQANYLREIIVKPGNISKLVPTSVARLNKFGNITGLRSNLRSGKFKIVKKGGTERLIDTRQKKQEKRVIAKKVSKKRHLIYNFYNEGEKGMRIVMTGIQGYFKIRKI